MADAPHRENKIIDEIGSKFKVEGKFQRERRIWVATNKESLIALCEFARGLGFEHLSAISVTDWPGEGTFELTYHLWSYSERILLTIKTEIDRVNPVIDSVVPVWHGSAQIHERELHELFGVEFEGNQDLAPLFLEDWDGPPPFRKDFNWRDYVNEKYYDRGDERERAYWG